LPSEDALRILASWNSELLTFLARVDPIGGPIVG